MAFTIPEAAREELRKRVRAGLAREAYHKKLVTEEQLARLLEERRC